MRLNGLKFLLILLSFSVISCSQDSNRTTGKKNNNFYDPLNSGPNSLDGAGVGQKISHLIRLFPCTNGAGRFSMALAFNKTTQANVTQQYTPIGRISVPNIGSYNVKDTAVGRTWYNDIVVVREYGQRLDVIVYMCAAPPNNGSIGGQIGFLSTSSATNCNLNQISALNMQVTSNLGTRNIWAYPVNAQGPVSGICTTGL
jgi:hypothetical protein